MTITTVQATSQQNGVANKATGSFTSDGNVTIVNLGFKPRKFRAVNTTDLIIWEKFEGNAAAACYKQVAAGTLTAPAASDILFNSDGTVSLSATLVGTSKAIVWIAD